MVDISSQIACEPDEDRWDDRWTPAQSALFIVAASIGLWRLIGLAVASVL